MLVRDVMTTPAAMLRHDNSVREAIQLLAAYRVSALPVVDHDGRLVGVVSEADVIRGELLGDPDARDGDGALSAGPYLTEVGEVMSHHPITMRPDDDLLTAVDLMTSTTVKSLPVTIGRTVVGMVSRTDIVAYLARTDEAIEAEVDELLRQAGTDWLVDVTDGVVTIDGPQTAHEREVAQSVVATVAGAVGVRFVAESATHGRTHATSGRAARPA